jgi:hypothetical protein
MAKPRKTLQRQITEGDPGHKGRRNLREQARPSPTAQFDLNAGTGLSPRAKAIFDAATLELNKMHLLGAPDILIMTTMANSYADAEEAREEAERLRATGKKTRDVLQAIAREQKRADRKLQLFCSAPTDSGYHLGAGKTSPSRSRMMAWRNSWNFSQSLA